MLLEPVCGALIDVNTFQISYYSKKIINNQCKFETTKIILFSLLHQDDQNKMN